MSEPPKLTAKPPVEVRVVDIELPWRSVVSLVIQFTVVSAVITLVLVLPWFVVSSISASASKARMHRAIEQVQENHRRLDALRAEQER